MAASACSDFGPPDFGPTGALVAALAGRNAGMEALGHLASGIAHDFNNLLGAMSGAAEAMLARPGLDHDTAEDARQVRAGAERGAALVRRILAWGRPDTPAPQPLALDGAVRDVAALLRRSLGAGVHLELALRSAGRAVRIDPVQLDQVLVNLAVNARDAMPNGGTLTLRTGTALVRRAVCHQGWAAAPGRYVRLEVHDTGAGIPPALLPRIFEPFFTTRHAQGGTGLGLATVRDIVLAAGGFVRVRSAPGAGTRIAVHLPCCAPAAEAAPPRSRTAGPRSVVLVEDEAPMRRLAERALAAHGWRVQAVDCAGAALEASQAEAPALVVSDLSLPGMDGPALVRAMRHTRPGLPAILVSGYADESLRQSLRAERIAFLPKPYALEGLAALAEQAILLP